MIYTTEEISNMKNVSVDQHQDVKKIRLSEWKGMVEQELQQRMVIAAEIRKTMNEAKTSTKRNYFGKKFRKINDEIYRHVSALQSITAQEAAYTPDPTTTLNLTPTHEDDQPITVA